MAMPFSLSGGRVFFCLHRKKKPVLYSPASRINWNLVNVYVHHKTQLNWDLKNNYMPTIFLTVFAVLIVNLLPIFALAVLDHQFVF